MENEIYVYWAIFVLMVTIQSTVMLIGINRGKPGWIFLNAALSVGFIWFENTNYDWPTLITSVSVCIAVTSLGIIWARMNVWFDEEEFEVGYLVDED